MNPRYLVIHPKRTLPEAVAGADLHGAMWTGSRVRVLDVS